MSDPVREVTVRISTGKILRILTNDLDAPAQEIADLYKQRWQIELFFKWAKQNLRIRHFLGTSENAIRIQIFVALIAYILIRMAQATQTDVLRILTFTRLVRVNIMHRRSICWPQNTTVATGIRPKADASPWPRNLNRTAGFMRRTSGRDRSSAPITPHVKQGHPISTPCPLPAPRSSCLRRGGQLDGEGAPDISTSPPLPARGPRLRKDDNLYIWNSGISRFRSLPQHRLPR